jgi:tRNA wybutosine-synthesizing protein 1
VDDPEDIVDGCIEAQRELLSGFGGNENVPAEKLEEAMNPNQAAISLIGEPTMYPRISDLIKEFHSREFTTFLVTNGTLPKRIEGLEELPTNLYISLEAPDEELYKKLCNPVEKDSWGRIQRSLDLIEDMDTKTVLRITCMKGFNMDRSKEFGELMDRTGFDFVEAKGYMHIGYSQERMPRDAMPSHEAVRSFSEKLEASSNYRISDEKQESRVILLEK